MHSYLHIVTAHLGGPEPNSTIPPPNSNMMTMLKTESRQLWFIISITTPPTYPLTYINVIRPRRSMAAPWRG